MPFLNIETIPLHGTHWLEASAGTGKTHQLVNMYLRLLIEQDYTVEQILVVTFTEAATQELRVRLQQRLQQLLLQPQEAEPWLQQRLKAFGSPANHRLQQALSQWDGVKIETIHGFCQRVLNLWAFEAGWTFERELLPNEQELIQKAVTDFWRQHFYPAPESKVAYALGKQSSCSIAHFMALVNRYLATPGIQLGPKLSAQLPDLTALWQAYRSCYQQMRYLWHTEGRHSMAAFSKNSLKGYREDYWQGRAIAMGDFLSHASPPTDLPDKLTFFTLAYLQSNWKEAAPIPGAACWEAVTQLLALKANLDHGWQQHEWALQQEMCTTVYQRLQQVKNRQNVVSFQDLLVQVEHALRAEGGARLAAHIRIKHPIALIDEFQDTDRIQARIFTHIYPPPDANLIVIGDPKQSIYRFRGADIAQYGAVAAQIPPERHHMMGHNWRSHPALLQAVNTLFTCIPDPFSRTKHLPLIDFQPVAPAPILWPGHPLPALQIRLLAEAQDAPGWAAAEVSQWLHRHPDRPASDLAVLVRSGIQGEQIQAALQSARIPCVLYRDESVWRSVIAPELEWVLRALAEPHEKLILTALATPLLGWNTERLFALQHDERQWEHLLTTFRTYHEYWLYQGFGACWAALTQEQQVEWQVAQAPDGLRHLTDLRHLCQLLLAEEPRQQGIQALCTWYRRQLELQPVQPDMNLTQMAQDTAAVKIVTIHRSKGLEYPVVVCPFLWKGIGRLHTPWADYYDPQTAAWHLDVSSKPEHVALMQAEEQAEELRLTYVALTRAQEHCFVAWAPQWKAWNPFNHLLGLNGPEQATQLWFELQNRSAGAIEVSQPPECHPYSWPAEGTKDGGPRFLPPRPPTWRTSSFTALTARHSVATEMALERPEPGEQLHMGDFPRGTQAGVFLHQLLAHMPFSGAASQLYDYVVKACGESGYATQWVPVLMDCLNSVLNARLHPDDPGFTLRGLSPTQRVSEMEFQFSFGGYSAPQLRALLTEHGLDGAGFKRLATEGVMRGAMDLVFCHQEKYYLVDYKSHYVGYLFDDYHKAALEKVMQQFDYRLQALIYSVALHRYLGYRLAHYDYERHFGGVFALFVRGMGGSNEQGILFEWHAPKLIAGLSTWLGREHGVSHLERLEHAHQFTLGQDMPMQGFF